MTRILSIGNSFSEDATAYLHDLAAAGGDAVRTVNLYIGGCPLKDHWDNLQNRAAAYLYEENGQDTGRMVSIQEALSEGNWDIITLQQASHDSGLYETYQPYLIQLTEYLRAHAPKATLWIHQTWAYETDSDHGSFPVYDCDQQRMYRALKDAYQKAAESVGASLIPCGELIQKLRTLPAFDYKNGGQSLCRDGFHLHLVYGRYAAAALWYALLLGGNVENNPFVPPKSEGECDTALLSLIKEAVSTLAKQTGRM